MEIFLYLTVILVGGLGFTLGSLFSPRIKSLKADLKYTEGKLHRERQNNKDEKEEQVDIEKEIKKRISLIKLAMVLRIINIKFKQ